MEKYGTAIWGIGLNFGQTWDLRIDPLGTLQSPHGPLPSHHHGSCLHHLLSPCSCVSISSSS